MARYLRKREEMNEKQLFSLGASALPESKPLVQKFLLGLTETGFGDNCAIC